MKRNKFKLLAALAACMSFQTFAQEVGQVERLISPEITQSNDVIFRLKAPAASSVKLSGNWWPWSQIPMGKGLVGN
jgi:hypothetical protein